ncbi:hypothetical protein LCGC14_2242490, partial [marine sediment metagenome]
MPVSGLVIIVLAVLVICFAYSFILIDSRGILILFCI